MSQATKRRATGRVRAATLAEVAAQAGVSTVAASVVLNRSRSGTRVSPATRGRIIEAAESLQYTPNAIARSLRKQSTDVVAFYNAQNTFFDPRYPFFAAILAGIAQGCEEQNKDLHIHGKFRGGDDQDIYTALLNGQIDGLVLYARTVTPLIERLVQSHLPVISVAEEVPGVPYVGIDEAGGSRQLARHLKAKGYQRVLYRRTDEVLPSTLQDRFEAFCYDAQLLDLELLHTKSDPASSTLTTEEQEILLSRGGGRPDAVVCWSDFSADGIAAFCRQNGIDVPGELALVGFDGLPSNQRPALSLTTIAAPWSEVARVAVGLLAAQCAGEIVPLRTVLPVELLVGSTT